MVFKVPYKLFWGSVILFTACKGRHRVTHLFPNFVDPHSSTLEGVSIHLHWLVWYLSSCGWQSEDKRGRHWLVKQPSPTQHQLLPLRLWRDLVPGRFKLHRGVTCPWWHFLQCLCRADGSRADASGCATTYKAFLEISSLGPSVLCMLLCKAQIPQ